MLEVSGSVLELISVMRCRRNLSFCQTRGVHTRTRVRRKNACGLGFSVRHARTGRKRADIVHAHFSAVAGTSRATAASIIAGVVIRPFAAPLGVRESV
jgi:hypothetical protein